jgi:hypothetical protein
MRSCLYLLGITVLSMTLAFAQDARPSHGMRKQGPGDHDHDLVLTLSQDQSEPANSTALKDCLVSHPSAACALLTLTLKNEGKETLLSWFSTCNDVSIRFALLEQDDKWKPLPTDVWGVCVSDMLGEHSLPPGKNTVVHLRLSERSLQISSDGYALLASPLPLTIRASWTIWGCAARGQITADATSDPVVARRLCAPGTVPKQAFAVALSNILTIKATALVP